MTTAGDKEGADIHHDPYCYPASSPQLIITDMMIKGEKNNGQAMLMIIIGIEKKLTVIFLLHNIS